MTNTSSSPGTSYNLNVTEGDREFAAQILEDFGTFEEGVADQEKLAQWVRNIRHAAERAGPAQPSTSPVTDAMVERAWAAIVGTDVAGMCFQASIIRGDLRTALEAVISPAQPSAPPDPEAWMRDDGSAATINPMIAAGWKAQGGRAIPLYAAPQAASVAQPQSIADETFVINNPDGSVSLDAYAGKSRDELKDRCGELCMALEDWRFTAVSAATDGGNTIENVREPYRSKIAQVIEAYSDDDDTSDSSTTTTTREALEEINALISNGDRPTVNERNAFEHFTVLNRLLLNIRDIARRALSSVPSTDKAPIGGTESCTCHFLGAGMHHIPGCPYYAVVTSKLHSGEK